MENSSFRGYKFHKKSTINRNKSTNALAKLPYNSLQDMARELHLPTKLKHKVLLAMVIAKQQGRNDIVDVIVKSNSSKKTQEPQKPTVKIQNNDCNLHSPGFSRKQENQLLMSDDLNSYESRSIIANKEGGGKSDKLMFSSPIMSFDSGNGSFSSSSGILYDELGNQHQSLTSDVWSHDAMSDFKIPLLDEQTASVIEEQETQVLMSNHSSNSHGKSLGLSELEPSNTEFVGERNNELSSRYKVFNNHGGSLDRFAGILNEKVANDDNQSIFKDLWAMPDPRIPLFDDQTASVIEERETQVLMSNTASNLHGNLLVVSELEPSSTEFAGERDNELSSRYEGFNIDSGPLDRFAGVLNEKVAKDDNQSTLEDLWADDAMPDSSFSSLISGEDLDCDDFSIVKIVEDFLKN